MSTQIKEFEVKVSKEFLKENALRETRFELANSVIDVFSIIIVVRVVWKSSFFLSREGQFVSHYLDVGFCSDFDLFLAILISTVFCRQMFLDSGIVH